MAYNVRAERSPGHVHDPLGARRQTDGAQPIVDALGNASGYPRSVVIVRTQRAATGIARRVARKISPCNLIEVRMILLNPAIKDHHDHRRAAQRNIPGRRAIEISHAPGLRKQRV